VNLRGIEEDEPADPAEVLGRFLRALGVDGLAVPDAVEDRVNMYRGLLADRRILMILDHAASPDQVLPLISGSPTCAILINSRTRLGAVVGAHTINLDMLDPPGGRTIRAHRGARPDRVRPGGRNQPCAALRTPAPRRPGRRGEPRS
jgi:hypothetical protein